ncbi:MAG TPA: winged helix-turn-helix transcriptional regulator [Thermoplasmata archaeon]|nr:winged helix-turn-helix transcriptional regulator [Thermoplasmata archaeon]
MLGPVQGADVLDQLDHVDGALAARVAFGHSLHGREGETVVVVIAAEDATRLNRRLRFLRRLSSTGDLEGPFRDAIPPCTYRLTPLDWRILAALIANPNVSPARLARLVGVTLKTFTYHRSLLIERHAVFFLPRVDWSRLECVFLEMFCRRPEDVERVRAVLQARYPASIPVDLKGGEGISPGWNHSTCFGAWVPAHSPNRVHTLVRDASRIPGVRLVLSETSGPERLYLDWVNRRVAERIAATSAAVPGRTPSLGVSKRIAPATTVPTEGHEMIAH